MEPPIADIEALIIAAADPSSRDQKTITCPPICLHDLRANTAFLDLFQSLLSAIKRLDGKKLNRVEWINEYDRNTNPDKTIGQIRIHYSDKA